MKQVRQIIRDIPQHWVGDGFPVRSLFSYADGNQFDPFLLLDYAGPQQFAPANAARGVGQHPHRGFETVTIVYQGELEHRDSSGSHGTIAAGDVQWMTAASGVVHEEFHSQRFARDGGTLEMVQLWVNLPAADKMSPPRYQALLDDAIPRVSLRGGEATVRVIAGEFHGTRGAARTFTPINVWDLMIEKPGPLELDLPDGHTAMIVVQSGTIRLDDATATAVELVQFHRAGSAVHLHCDTPARLLILTGQPIDEPVVGHGPFVMNSREEIQQAIDDFRQGRMGRLTPTSG